VDGSKAAVYTATNLSTSSQAIWRNIALPARCMQYCLPQACLCIRNQTLGTAQKQLSFCLCALLPAEPERHAGTTACTPPKKGTCDQEAWSICRTLILPARLSSAISSAAPSGTPDPGRAACTHAARHSNTFRPTCHHNPHMWADTHPHPKGNQIHAPVRCLQHTTREPACCSSNQAFLPGYTN
jgi:hypothetical protein